MTMPTNFTVCKLAEGEKLDAAVRDFDFGNAAINSTVHDLLAKVGEDRDMCDLYHRPGREICYPDP